MHGDGTALLFFSPLFSSPPSMSPIYLLLYICIPISPSSLCNVLCTTVICSLFSHFFSVLYIFLYFAWIDATSSFIIIGSEWDEIKHITKQVVLALKHLHSQGCIHGDLKRTLHSQSARYIDTSHSYSVRYIHNQYVKFIFSTLHSQSVRYIPSLISPSRMFF